jgi:transposase
MTFLTLDSTEVFELEHLDLRPLKARDLQRAQALLWLAQRESVAEVAERLGVSRQTIYNWRDHFLDRRGQALPERLADAPRSGRPPTALGIIDPLILAVIKEDPQELGYRSGVWTAPLLAQYLRDQHRISVCEKSVQLAIARLRISWQRPRHQLGLRARFWRQAKGGLNAASKDECAPSC